MILRAIIKTDTPDVAAKWFQIQLAVDRGYASDILNDGAARIVVASDGQAVRFESHVFES